MYSRYPAASPQKYRRPYLLHLRLTSSFTGVWSRIWRACRRRSSRRAAQRPDFPPWWPPTPKATLLYLPLLGGDKKFQQGLLIPRGVDLRQVIESGGQGPEDPLDVLPLLHQVLEHLRWEQGKRKGDCHRVCVGTLLRRRAPQKEWVPFTPRPQPLGQKNPSPHLARPLAQ